MPTETTRNAGPADALRCLKGMRVFVTSRERIKEPEGEDLFDDCIESLEHHLAAGAPSAQQPLDDSANNAGVATGSRNESPCESVTRGSLPPLSWFKDADELASWLEQLCACDESGALTGSTWEPAVRAAAAIRKSPPVIDAETVERAARAGYEHLATLVDGSGLKTWDEAVADSPASRLDELRALVRVVLTAGNVEMPRG